MTSAETADLLAYLDSSAIVKLIVREPGSEELVAFVHDAELVSSELVLVEVPRAIRRLMVGRRADEQRALAREMERALKAIGLIQLDRPTLLIAGSFREAYLRTLDAIHVAAAISVADDLDAFVTYDDRQFSAGEAAGLQPTAPGSDEPSLR